MLHALIGGLEVEAASALPVQGAIAGAAGMPGEAETSAQALRLATLAAEGTDGAPDPVGVEAGLPAASQADVTEQLAVTVLLGAWQASPQSAASAVMLTEAGPDGSQAMAGGQGVAATLAGGRQQLPLSLPAVSADAQPGQLTIAPDQGDAEAILLQSITTDVTARPVQHPLQPTADGNAIISPERSYDLGRTAMSREVVTMQLPLRAQGWDGELAQRIVWMAGRQTQWAEITLNPPNLGNLEVHLSLKGNDASAYFYSPHPAVREAIDESLSRLREMLAGVGISLGQTQVSQESFRDRRGGGATGYPHPGEYGIEPEAAAPSHSGRGLVDLFV
ncbi:MAG: flagellar hook-length control protein FliK [Thiobacillaceae bacterium]